MIFCCKHQNEILKLINIIPHINWSVNELLSQDEDFYKNKWRYSYVIKNCNNKIIGIMVCYFRKSDDKHIFDSLYIHKFAIDPNYQKCGIGTEVIKYFINKSFAEIPWLLNISVQTNLCIENEHVVRFYKNFGFKEMYKILYTNKVDILLLLERKCFTMKQTDFKESIQLRHPRLNIYFDFNRSINALPTIYFSSSNSKKKK